MWRPPGRSSTPIRVATHATAGVSTYATTRPIAPATRNGEIVTGAGRTDSGPTRCSRSLFSLGRGLHYPRDAEQLAHRLLGMDPLHGLADQPRHRNHGEFGGPLLRRDGDAVGDHQLLDRRALDARDRGRRENRVGAARVYGADAALHERLGRERQ